MRTVIISIIVLLCVSLCFSETNRDRGRSRSDRKSVEPMPGMPFMPGMPGMPGQATETNSESKEKSKAFDPNDPNATDPNVADPNAKPEWLATGLEKLNTNDENKMREWERKPLEGKKNLVEAVQEQVEKEMNFIKEIAIEENAEKTIQAIEAVLEIRKQQLDNIIEKIEDARRKEKLRAREEDQATKGQRGGSRGRDRSPMPKRR